MVTASVPRLNQAVLATIDAFESLAIAVFPARWGEKGTYIHAWPEMGAEAAIRLARREASRQPSNLAGRTGDGVAVLDLDDKNGVDPAGMLALLRPHLGSAIIAVVETSRGFHIWLAATGSVGNGFCSAIGGEVFSEPHLAMLPPSVHPDGSHYRWLVGPRVPDGRVDLRSLGLIPDEPNASPERPRKREPAPPGAQRDFEAMMGEAGIARDRRVQALVRCPWHDDRSPSLSVNWETALFHCFGETCRVHGGLAALRRLLGKHTSTYRQGGSASPVGKLGCVDEEVERLAKALDAIGQADKARRMRECRSVYAVGECSACGIKPVYPLSCGQPLCPRCMAGRLAADWKEHVGSIPSSLTLLRLVPRDFWGVNRESIRKTRNRFREWRERHGIAAGMYGIRLDWRSGPVVLLAIPSEIAAPAPSRAFDVQVVAEDQSPDDFLGWLQDEYAEEAVGWQTEEDLALLLEQTRRRRRFQGFGGAYANANEEGAIQDAEASEVPAASSQPLRKVSGGTNSAKPKRDARLCPACGGHVEMCDFTVRADQVQVRDGFAQWLPPPGRFTDAA